MNVETTSMRGDPLITTTAKCFTSVSERNAFDFRGSNRRDISLEKLEKFQFLLWVSVGKKFGFFSARMLRLYNSMGSPLSSLKEEYHANSEC
jgi:hypothetical protein